MEAGQPPRLIVDYPRWLAYGARLVNDYPRRSLG